MRQWSYFSALSLCCVFGAAQPGTSQTYTVTDLGTFPGGTYSTALAIDEAGQVTGWSSGTYGPGGEAYSYAFIYRDGKLLNLGALGGDSSIGYGIASDPDDAQDKNKTEKGAQVTGAANTASGATHAFLYKDGLMRDLGLLPRGTTSQGNAINRLGEVAGEADNSTGIVVAFLYKHGTLIDLGAFPGGEGSLAFGINDLGDVTGTAGAGTDSDGFLYSNGKLRDIGKLPLPGANYSTGRAINNAREITGDSGILAGGSNHGFLYSKGKMVDLGLLPTGKSSSGMAINSLGQIVGVADVFVPYPPPITSPPGIHVGHGILYSEGKMHDLNAMIPANSGWVLGTASGINDRGQIAGTGTINNEIHGYLLTLDCSKQENKHCGQCKQD